MQNKQPFRMVSSITNLLRDQYNSASRLALSCKGEDFVLGMVEKKSGTVVTDWRSVAIAPGVAGQNIIPVAFVYGSHGHAVSINVVSITFTNSNGATIHLLGSKQQIESLTNDLAKILQNVPLHNGAFLSILTPLDYFETPLSDNSWEMAAYACMMGAPPCICSGSIQDPRGWDVSHLVQKAGFARTLDQALYVIANQIPPNGPVAAMNVNALGQEYRAQSPNPVMCVAVHSLAAMFLSCVLNETLYRMQIADESRSMPPVKDPTPQEANAEFNFKINTFKDEFGKKYSNTNFWNALRTKMEDLIGGVEKNRANADDLQNFLQNVVADIATQQSRYFTTPGKYMGWEQAMRGALNAIGSVTSGPRYLTNLIGPVMNVVQAVSSKWADDFRRDANPPQEAKPKSTAGVMSLPLANANPFAFMAKRRQSSQPQQPNPNNNN